MATADLNIIRSTWRGYIGLRYLVIFGDSYSDVGYQYNDQASVPSDEAPLGIEYPGITWAGVNNPNWVGHLITEHSPYTRLLVYDYAVGGDTVGGVRKQVRVSFLPRVGEKPAWAQWSADDSLFVTWVGINDCGHADTPESVSRTVHELFEEQECLYGVGARNFLFIDVPPIHRTPVGVMFSIDHPGFRRVYDVWNVTLRECISKFAADHTDVTTLLFSSWDTFTRVLDDPVTHGFSKDQTTRAGGDIWFDTLHPSTQMHDWIAHDLAKFLYSQPAYSPSNSGGNEVSS